MIYTIGHVEAFAPALAAGVKIVRKAGCRAFSQEGLAWDWLMERNLEGWAVWETEGTLHDLTFDDEDYCWRLNKDREVVGV